MEDAPRRKRSHAARTAAKRKHTNLLLKNLVAPNNLSLEEVKLPLLEAPSVDWECSVNKEFDPQQGGKLKQDTPRSRRKRLQVEAFLHLCQQLLLHTTNDDDTVLLVDAGSGAGNLTIPLAGLLQRHVLAIDMNPVALDRLDHRASGCCSNCQVSTLCSDLASAVLPVAAGIVCSLHACGAATDMALRLATQHRSAFVMSPCCTGKANTIRTTESDIDGPSGRSGAPIDITYPRSRWLKHELEEHVHGTAHDNQTASARYVALAKVADVGLGPQTPDEQRRHQRVAKYVVEMDRLMGVVEEHDYRVQLYRLKEHEGYGKAEIFVGVPKEHPAAQTMEWMPDLD